MDIIMDDDVIYIVATIASLVNLIFQIIEPFNPKDPLGNEGYDCVPIQILIVLTTCVLDLIT